MLEKVKDLLCEYKGLERDDIKEESTLLEDLGFTSYELLELCGEMEERYDMDIDETKLFKIETVGDLVSFLEQEEK